jgi:hypothetical protein
MACDAPNCTVTIVLVAQGGTGCGIEVTGGVAYSIGGQNISYTATDACGVISTVTINGGTPPVFVADGATITVGLTVVGAAEICSTDTVTCPMAMGMLFKPKNNNGKLSIVVNRELLIKKINKIKMSRR